MADLSILLSRIQQCTAVTGSALTGLATICQMGLFLWSVIIMSPRLLGWHAVYLRVLGPILFSQYQAIIIIIIIFIIAHDPTHLKGLWDAKKNSNEPTRQLRRILWEDCGQVNMAVSPIVSLLFTLVWFPPTPEKTLRRKSGFLPAPVNAPLCSLASL